MDAVAPVGRVRDNTNHIKQETGMDLAEVTQKIQSALAGGSDFDKTVKFDFGDVGKVFVDGPNNTASNEDKAANATVRVSFDDFKALAAGQLDPMQAFMSGKVAVDGDMSVAMKLQSLLSKLS